MHDDFRFLTPARITAAAPLMPAAFDARVQRSPAANESLFRRVAQRRHFLRTTRRHLLMLAGLMGAVLLAGAWAGQATAGGPLALSLLYAFGGCVPAGLAGVQLQQAQAVLQAFAQRRADPLEAAARIPAWREGLAFAAGALAFSALAYGLLG